MSDNVCLSCGACCAAFRVSFDRHECDDHGGQVPSTLADEETQHLRRMRGTDYARPRCIALIGKVGESVRCGIYEQRPGPCREFAPLAEMGHFSMACNRARRRHGLPGLPVTD